MKKYLWIIPLALVVGACSIEEPSNSGGSILYPAEVSATIDESYADPDVRAYVDADLKILWENDDRISLFNQYTFNKEYRFSGRTGANSGVFKEVTSGDVVVGNELDNVYAVYPYMELTEISNSGVITLDLPAEQTYKANSFGRGDNTMVSATTNTNLMFKNLCGYLVLKFYGEGVSVSSISLRGNNGEPLAGTADVTANVGGVPTFSFWSSGTYDTITLNCDPPVQLGTSADDATVFWLVVPPTAFTGGITLTVTDSDGGIFVKESTANIKISRNSTFRVKAIEVVPSPSHPYNVIYYTSTDGSVVTPNRTDVFGANYVSSTYENGQGIITFDSDVTMIGSSAFNGCQKLNSIIIPDSVTEIKSQAFSGTRISSLAIPKSVTQLDPLSIVDSYVTNLEVDPDNTVYDSRDNCNAVIKTATNSLVMGTYGTTIPETVTSIGNAAFINNQWITEITIPNSVTSIGSFAFSGCQGLGAITVLATTPPTGGSNMFDSSSCPIYVPGESVETYKSAQYWSDYAPRIQIPRNIIYYTSLDGEILEPSNSNFGAAIVSNSYQNGQGVMRFDREVTSIGERAFDGCSNLKSITLPNSVTSIGYNAFYGCSNLSSITIPDSVTSIGGQAFYECSNLTAVTIPGSVISIGGNPFYYCRSLSSIVVDSDNSVYDSRNNCNAIIKTETNELIAGCSTTNIPGSVTSIGFEAFRGCNLGTFIIPDNVTSIASQAFWECSLTSITLPNSLTTIKDGTFYASTLPSITIPSSVTTIEGGAFYSCGCLTSITIPDSVISIESQAFSCCYRLSSVTIPDSVTSIGDYAFDECPNLTTLNISGDSQLSLYNLFSGITHVVFLEGSTKIGSSIISGIESITTVTIPNSVTSIGNGAFSSCTNLKSVTIPDGVTSIGKYAFASCYKLSSVNIPDGVTSIEERTFELCPIREITIPSSVTTIGANAFGCSGLTTLVIPSSVTTIEGGAFGMCGGLTSITIPENVTYIGNCAFQSCTGLSSIVINAIIPPELGLNAFDDTNDCPIHVPSNAIYEYSSSQYWANYSSRIEGYIFPTEPGEELPDFVELGLSVRWARCNVGAFNPTDVGYYFAWGETSPKKEFSLSSYKLCKGSDNTITRYCYDSSYGYNGYTDNWTRLSLSDDAAGQMSGDWRMPTKEEYEELISNCTCEYVEDYNQSGVSGIIMHSKRNSESIFFPSTGYYIDGTLQNPETVNLWTASLSVAPHDTFGPSCADHFFYNPSQQNNPQPWVNFARRYFGLPIRPVYFF